MREWIELHRCGLPVMIRKGAIIAVLKCYGDGGQGSWVYLNGSSFDIDESYEEVKKMLDDKAAEE